MPHCFRCFFSLGKKIGMIMGVLQRISVAGLLTACACPLLLQSLSAAQVDVVVFAGQSNMTGAGADYTSIAASAVDGQTPYFYDTQGSDLGVERFDSGGVFETLHGVSIRPNPSEPILTERFGPEIGFARKMAELNASFNLSVVKVSFGNSVMSDWAKAGGGAFGNAYNDRLISGLNTALGLITNAGDTPVVRGFVWVQGESDAFDTLNHGQFYEERLGQFLSDFRTDISVPSLPFLEIELNNGLGTSEANKNLLRQEQINHVASDPNAVLVSVAGLALSSSDSRHYEAAEMLLLGERIAQSFNSNFVAVPEPVHAIWISFGLIGWGFYRRRCTA